MRIAQGWRTRVLNWVFLGIAAALSIPGIEGYLPKWAYLMLLFAYALGNLILREHTTTPAGNVAVASTQNQQTIVSVPTPNPVGEKPVVPGVGSGLV